MGDVIQLVAIAGAPLTRTTITGIPAQSILVLIGMIMLVGGMLALPLGFTFGRERLRFWMDTATVLAAGIGINFYLLTPRSLQDTGRQISNMLGGMAIFLVAQFAVVKLLLSNTPPFTRRAGLMMLAAAVVQVQGAEATTVEIHQLNWIMDGTVLGKSLVAVAAIVQSRQLTHCPSTIGRPRKRPFSLLPYGSIVATYALLVLMQAGLDLRAWAVLTAAIVSTFLVIARQILAFVDNARLAAALDAEVRQRNELTAALEYQAHHDCLTGLANRALFTDQVDRPAAAVGPADSRAEGSEAKQVPLSTTGRARNKHRHHEVTKPQTC